MKTKLILISVLALLLGCGSSKKNNAEPAKSNVVSTPLEITFTDKRDGKAYKIVKIGEQTWMAENLGYIVAGSKCYNNDQINCAKYGRLYSWSMAMALPPTCDATSCSSQIQQKHQGICPEGWYISKTEDWNKIKDLQLMAKEGWDDCSPFGTGNPSLCGNSQGFSAMPGGSSYGGNFTSIGTHGYWWNADEHDGTDAYRHQITARPQIAVKNYLSKDRLLSVRCVSEADMMTKTKAEVEEKAKKIQKRENYIKTNGGTFTDSRDKKNKKTYKTIKIGKQTWMAENLNYISGYSKCQIDKPSNCDKYGRLYDFETANNACPKGWHLPTKDEWDVLHKILNEDDDEDGFGFMALPGGKADDKFLIMHGKWQLVLVPEAIGKKGFWLTSTMHKDSSVYISEMNYSDRKFSMDSEKKNKFAYSVRCVKN
ncbi:MAG: hypothetical protein FWB90_07460 [Fibromonadales bacterium]|nr:hypothetical protein [Fibromonadales bacterium]